MHRNLRKILIILLALISSALSSQEDEQNKWDKFQGGYEINSKEMIFILGDRAYDIIIRENNITSDVPYDITEYYLKNINFIKYIQYKNATELYIQINDQGVYKKIYSREKALDWLKTFLQANFESKKKKKK